MPKKKEKPPARNARGGKAAQKQTLIQRMSGSIARMRTGADLMASRVRMVRTIFPGLNRAAVSGAGKLMGASGWPMGTTAIVHGRERGGKSTLLAGIAQSFMLAGGTVCYVESEMSTQLDWFWTLGVDPAQLMYIGRFAFNERPKDKVDLPDLYYEDVVEQLDEVVGAYRDDCTAGNRPGPLLIVIDSLTKLMPKSVVKQIESSGGNLRKATLGMTQAAFNTILCADMGVKIADFDIAVVFVCHEADPIDSGRKSFGAKADTKVKGGSGIRYDANLMLQLSFAGRVYDTSRPASKGEDTRDDRPVTGKKHRVRFEKTKMGPQAYGDHSSFEYFISTGVGRCALGFDRPREIVNEAIRRGVVLEDGAPAGSAWDRKELTLGRRFELDGKSFTLKSLYDEDGAPTERVAEIAHLLGAP